MNKYKTMKTDPYTKVVLTIIATCLTVLTLQQIDLIPKAYASNNENTNNLLYGNYGMVPLNEDGSITVKLSSSSEIDVNITGVQTSEELNINIDEIGGSFVSSGGPIPVEIK